MGIIGWIFFGLVVGVVGKFLMPGVIRVDGSLLYCWE